MSAEATLSERMRKRGQELYEQYKSEDGSWHPAMLDADLMLAGATALDEGEANLSRLAESLGIDKQAVVDDLKAWPAKASDSSGDALSSDYVSKLMRQAAAIIETGRTLTSTHEMWQTTFTSR